MPVTTTYNWTQTAAPTLVNSYAPGNENSPTLTASADGTHYFSAWTTPLASDAVLGRLEGQNGQPSGAEFTLNTTQTGDQNDVSLATLQNGNYVAAFTDYSTGNGDIRLRMFGSDGHALAPDFLADNDPMYKDIDDSQADVAVLKSGKIVVTSTAYAGTSDSDIHFLMYDQNGAQLQPRYAVNDALDAVSNSSIAALTGGGFIVAYQANTGGNNRVEFTRFDDNGTILGGNDLGGTDIDHIGNNTDIQAVGLSDGGFVVAYTDTGWNISGSEITARIYNADGTARTNYIFVNQDGITNGNQDHASLTALSNGDFAISWKSGTDEYIRAFDSTGTALTGSTLLAHNVVDAEISALSNGMIANVYQSTDVDAGGDNSIRTNIFELSRTITGTPGGDDLSGDSLPDHFDGGAGEDMVIYYNATSGVTASLLNPAINTGIAAGDTYVSVEDMYGTDFDDFLQGDNGNNIIYVGNGNDTVYGEGGDDMFWMGNVNSYGHLYGGDGNDTFWGSYSKQGQSVYTGGAGDDLYWVSNANTTVVENPGEGHDTIHFNGGIAYTLPDNVEDLYLEVTSSAKIGYGNDLDNHIYGNYDSTMEGRGGNDTFDWLWGNNKLDGGTGFDTAVFWGTRADHIITRDGATVTVANASGTNTLTSVEKLVFDDTSIALQAPGSDFNGDGHSDVLLRGADGSLWMNLYNGVNIVTSGAAGTPSLDWDVAGIADFDGDGKSDIALRNHNDGHLWFNLYNGTSIVTSGAAGTPSLDWDVAGTGDFNGDGKSDMLLRNHNDGHLWLNFYDGFNIAGSGSAGTPTLDWDVAGVGDFNSDGHSDVMLRNHNTGQLWVNLYDGVNIIGSGAAGSPSLDWDVAGVGDFNFDGHSDMVLRNHNTGELWVNLYDGANIISSGSAGMPSLDWDVEKVADYNGDGHSDVMLRNHNTGELWVNMYDGTNIINSGSAGTPTLDWHMIGV
jgi:hypothetical protein